MTPMLRPHKWQACKKCALSSCRTRVVYGEGNQKANVLIVGDAPGEHGDRNGRPFQGPVGDLIDKLLLSFPNQAFESGRHEFYITNVIACRTPRNRPPEKDEVEACYDRLCEIIEAVDPLVIVAMGELALKTLTGTKKKISVVAKNPEIPNMRAVTKGRILPEVERPCFATHHPAFILQKGAKEVEGSPLHQAWQTFEKAISLADMLNYEYSGESIPERDVNAY